MRAVEEQINGTKRQILDDLFSAFRPLPRFYNYNKSIAFWLRNKEQARAGVCNAALVAGANIILSPFMFEEYNAMKVLTNDGISKVFDKDSKGFVRAEAISVIFLQKRKDAKRIYADLVYSLSNNDGFKIEGPSLPSQEIQQKLMTQFYQDINFDPREIKFFEAHATGTKLGDLQEINAIDGIICKNRSDELIIGSVKSNMGHSEGAAGIASIAKILIAFENGKFPPNINLTKLREDISAFKESRIVVAADAIDLTSPYIGMNSFGLGGSNIHLLFKQNTKIKENRTQNDERMVLWSGRTEEAIHAIFDDITSRPLDIEHIALLHNSQILTPDANSYRGFGIFKNAQETAICIDRNVQNFDGIRRQVVFCFSGMGTQWHGMGRELMNISLFSDSIEKSHKILLQKGINLKEILNSNNEKIYKNVLNSYVGIISIEIALFDVLTALNIKPNWIVGHSLGEIACSYADGCLSREEALTVVYLRAKTTANLNINMGAMAAVGMHFNELEKILPNDIDIACHNSKQSTTISGTKNSVLNFIEYLKSQKNFVKEVACAGVPFHSRYMQDVGNKLEKELLEIFKEPKIRSSKWITSTYIEDNEQNKFCNAKYHADNVRNPVHFEEATSKLSKNSIVIEISAHGLLQSLLKSTLNEGFYISLANKNQTDGKSYFMKSLGKLFQAGVDFDISKLYPAVEFPVSRGTAMISPIIKWNHQESHFVPRYESKIKYERTIQILNFNNKELQYLTHYIIDQKMLVPAAFWIVCVWKQFAKKHECLFDQLKISIKDFKIMRAIYIDIRHELDIIVSIKNDKFEISEGNDLIVSGTIVCNDDLLIQKIENQKYNENSIVLTRFDFYKHLRILGYQYLEKFQSVYEITDDGINGKIKWEDNWVLFIENMLQTNILSQKTENLQLPFALERLDIDPIMHKRILNEANGSLLLFEKKNNQMKCGGIKYEGYKTIRVDRKIQQNLLMEFSKFIPFTDCDEKYKIFDALKILTAAYTDLNFKSTYSFLEVNNEKNNFMCKHLNEIFKNHPATLNLKLLSDEKIETDDIEVIFNEDILNQKNIDIIFAKNCIKNDEIIRKFCHILSSTGVLILQEYQEVKIDNQKYEILFKLKLNDRNVLIMLRLKPQKKDLKIKAIEITSKTLKRLENLKEEIRNCANKNCDSIILYSHRSAGISGLLGIHNRLRIEYNGINLKCLLIEDLNAPSFNIDDPFYKNQLEKGFAVNVLKNGKWGGYRHIDINLDNSLKPYNGHCFAYYSIPGNLSTLNWHKGYLNENFDNEDLIKVQYFALNFRDINCIYGFIPNKTRLIKEGSIGFEFSGIRMKTGERVMGITQNQGLTSYVYFNDAIIMKVPENVSLEDAATISMAYITVYYSFFGVTCIKKGNSILIHNGASAVGQAAIQTALAYGFEVFTTVNTKEKREFLLQRFQQLKDENIGNSCDISFIEMIMKITNNKGVDYVLNSLTGEKMIASLKCLGQNGVFLEIGKVDYLENTKIDFNIIEKNISLKLIMIDKLNWSSDDVKKIIKTIDQDLVNRIIKPLHRTVYNASDIQEAFQYMSTDDHIGKILIKMRENENDLSTLPFHVQPKFYCNSEHSYIIIGNLDGLGFEFSQWLISRKCRKLVLNSRDGISNQYQAFKIKYWKSFGVEVIVSTSNVLCKIECEELFKTATTLGSVGGIFHFAAAVQNDSFDNQLSEDFNPALAPKILATKNLHEISQKYCPMLKHFVVYSDCERSNQTIFEMENSIIERIIEERHEMKLPTKVIQYDAIDCVNFLSNMELQSQSKLTLKNEMQTITSFLQQQDILLNHSEPIVVCTVAVNKKKILENKKSFINILMDILNIDDRKNISMSATFSQIGIDSLIGIEIYQMIEKEYGILIPLHELRSLTISEIDEKINSFSIKK